MAIIQISKIQQRSGNLVDLPQLDEAQFGWANDVKRLFIGATGNTTTNVENVEVLTSYSTISFSQVEGSDGSNVNITNVLPGQILGYDTTLNAWVNTGGNAEQPNDAGSGIPIHLGAVSNVKISGGASGYILETDGAGNLSWTSKGALRTSIIDLVPDSGNGNIIVMTVDTTTPYTNGLEITISGANATNANTIVNGLSFYIDVGVDFPTTGEVTLYTDPTLTTPSDGTNLGLNYVANSGVATASLAAAGSSTAGGANTQIQYNDGGILNGSANFTISGDFVSLTGNFNASNIAGGNTVTANYFTGTLTTQAQPNITSTGTLASLSVAANANIGNIGTAGIITATGNITAGNIITGGIVTATGNITGGNINTGGVISATGNANIGNIGTAGLITATGNITGGNLVTGGVVSASGNASVLGIKTDNYYYANGVSISFAGTYSNSNVSAFLAVFGSNTITTTGNISVGNVSTGGVVTATGNVTGGNIVTTGLMSASGTITGGNLATAGTLSVGGNANIGNIGTAGVVTATGNITGGNLVTGGLLSVTGNANVGNIGATAGVFTGTVSATGNANVGNLGTSGLITSTGNITGGNLVTGGVVSASGNASVLGIKTDNYYYANGTPLSFSGTYGDSNVVSLLSSYGSNTISTTGNVTAGNVVTNKYLINSVQTGISAAGSTQGTATALANTVNIVSTVSSGNGVVLPTAVAGMTIYITNTSATNLLVYPATGAAINELSTNVGFTHPTKATLHYVAASTTQWYSVGATYA